MGHVEAVAFTPDSRTLLTLAQNQVKRWDPATGDLKQTLIPKDGSVGRTMCMALSPDGKTVAVGGSSPLFGLTQYPDGHVGQSPGEVWLWDLSTGAPRPNLHHNDGGEVVSLAFSSDSKTLASGSQHGGVQLWDTHNWTSAAHLQVAGPVWTVAFSPNGKTLATGSATYDVELWDPGAGKPLGGLSGHQHLILSLAFSPDGKTLASGSYDETLKLWEVETRKVKRTLPMGGWVHALQFAPNGKTLAIGLHDKSEAGALRLWEVNDGV